MLACKTVNEFECRIKNLTYHNLTPKGTAIPIGIRTLLGLSLRFCPTPTSVPLSAYSDSLFSLRRQIRMSYMFNSRLQYNKLTYVPNPQFQPKSAPQRIEQLLINSYNSLMKNSALLKKPSLKCNLNNRQRKLLQQLKYQKELKILNTDKNLGPAIMSMQQYREFCLNHLQQADIYEQVDSIPLKTIQLIIKQYHKELIKKHPYAAKQAKIIIHNIDYTTTAYFHALPKIHKSPMGCRPIVSNINTPTHGLSRWLTAKLLPYAQQMQSFVRDSSTFQQYITSFEPKQQDELIIFDVENMYTSIPVKNAIDVIGAILQEKNNLERQMIIKGLFIVLKYNYFTFGATSWKQLRGLAMGTPVAPIIATLYLGYYEEKSILIQFKNNLRVYKRYLDDVFILWSNLENDRFAFNKFRAFLRKVPGLKWTYERKNSREVNFLDLTVYAAHKYSTRTFFKKSLFLYPTSGSSHPPGTQLGLIYGILLKYKQQNSTEKDFYMNCRLFFQRLLQRGYKHSTLADIFKKCFQKLNNWTEEARKRKLNNDLHKYFLKIPYDPNGPSRTMLRDLLEVNKLSEVLYETGKGKITICYMRPKNLANLIMRTRLKPPTSSDASQVHSERSINPNPSV